MGQSPSKNSRRSRPSRIRSYMFFGAESSPSQSTPTAPKQNARPRESFPPCIPAVFLRTALRGRRPTDANGRNSKRRQRHHNRRVTLGGTRVRAKHSRWWFSQHGRRDRTLNKKQTAISAAKGAAQITLKTQRMIPSPRKKKQRQILWLLIMGI